MNQSWVTLGVGRSGLVTSALPDCLTLTEHLTSRGLEQLRESSSQHQPEMAVPGPHSTVTETGLKGESRENSFKLAFKFT